jgi:dolichyl-phosphate-mannose-protein mannosyltransferase
LVVLVAGVIGTLALVIRLALHGQAFDLFGDEIIYTNLGRSVINGGFPRFFGTVFFLHGPGYFYLEAGWAHLFGNPSGLMPFVYEMRMLNGLLAAVTAVALVLLATRAGSLRSGLAVGLLFALDPFCLRQNDRVLLETALMMWVILGYLVFVSLTGRSSSRGSVARAILAGLFFGFAVLTKDEGALLTILPLLAAMVLRWGPDRRLILVTLVTIVDVYVAYVTVVAANGYFSAFWSAKTAGVRRMLGLVQITGFHSKGGGSLTARLFAEVTYFGTTYGLLALAVVAVVVVLLRGDQVQRILGLLYCAAGVTLAYAVTLGTLEEQELYLLIVPSLLIIPVAVTMLGASGRRLSRSGTRSLLQVARVWVATAGLVLILGINLVTATLWWRQPDDGWTLLFQYLSAHVPAGTVIANGTDSPQDIISYALPPRWVAGVYPSQAAYDRAHVRYILVEWGEVDEGYSALTPAQVRFFTQGGRVIFSVRDRTYGVLELYQLP